MSGDTREVRSTEQLDWAALTAYLRSHLSSDAIAGLDLDRELDVSQFPGGHSNLTYLVRFGGAELVLRRPPLGPVPPKAHDMAREFQWLAALHPFFPLAPRPYLLCEDVTVIGSVFYLLGRRRGVVVRRDEPVGLAHREEARQRLSEVLVDTLAELHAIDVTRKPFVDLGKPLGFVERQVRGWSGRWEGSKLTDVPEMDALSAWLIEHLPPNPAEPAIVHGDYKLDNVLLDPLDVGRMVAIFDWEMCALGDPLVDLGIFLAYWKPTAPPSQRDALSTVTDNPGYFTREQIIERYALRS